MMGTVDIRKTLLQTSCSQEPTLFGGTGSMSCDLVDNNSCPLKNSKDFFKAVACSLASHNTHLGTRSLSALPVTCFGDDHVKIKQKPSRGSLLASSCLFYYLKVL